MTLIVLPATAYILLALIFTRRWGVREMSEALVKGHIILFTVIAVSTELLSLIDGISFPAILTTWLLLLLICFVIVFVNGKKHGFLLPVIEKIPPLAVILVGAVAFILATTFAAAILYPPNNWDSMTYHMPRVAHWISNNNVSFYPTNITRQNYLMPLAEFAIMHIQILTNYDLYANLIQWISFLVLICLGFLIAGELGLSNRQQFVSAIVITTLPMAILQASSTQNDLVVSSFLMSFSLFMLRLRETLTAKNLILASISLGLALFTKGTAFLYSAAIGISLAIPVLMARKYNRMRFLKAATALSLIVIMALLMNTGHFLRNYHLYGHPLSTEAMAFRNEDISAVTLASNILRNGALHLGTPSSRINEYQLLALQFVLGSELNNPKTTHRGASFGIPFSRHEDSAGNLIHMLITLSAIVLLPIIWRQGHHTRAIWYAVGIMLGAILYCLISQWQPWASRLHTPLFTLAAPLLAITITSDNGGVRTHIGNAIILCMLFYSTFFALTNMSRSLISLEWYRYDRMQLYFQNRKNLYNDYKSAMKVVGEANNGDVGLYLGGDDWEYPFWVFARQTENHKRAMTFRHIRGGSGSFIPLYVIATKPIRRWDRASEYVPIYTSDHVNVFRKSGQ